MTRVDIIRMAEQAGFVIDQEAKKYQPNCISHTHYLIDEPLTRFAALVAASERENAEKPWVKTYSEGKPQYTTPREWHELTDEEIQQAWDSMNHDPAAFVHFAGGALWAEAKCKEKNG